MNFFDYFFDYVRFLLIEFFGVLILGYHFCNKLRYAWVISQLDDLFECLFLRDKKLIKFDCLFPDDAVHRLDHIVEAVFVDFLIFHIVS